MSKLDRRPLIILALLMATFVVASNFLVQFPIKYFGMEELLTYGAFTYPVTFLITDLSNRRYGKLVARKIVYFGFILGITLTLIFSTNFSELISIRIAIGSGTAFLFAQLLDVQIFDKLRKKNLVCCSICILINWFFCRHIFIFFNIILWNQFKLDYFRFRRFCCKDVFSNNYAYPF